MLKNGTVSELIGTRRLAHTGEIEIALKAIKERSPLSFSG